jgi:hypothetical protein
MDFLKIVYGRGVENCGYQLPLRLLFGPEILPRLWALRVVGNSPKVGVVSLDSSPSEPQAGKLAWRRQGEAMRLAWLLEPKGRSGLN